MTSKFAVRLGLPLISLVIVLFWMSLHTYVPILPVYAAEQHGASLEIVGLIVSAYGLSQMLLRIPYGYFSDRLKNRKRFVTAGLGLSILSGVGLALAPSAGSLVAFRALAGAAAAAWAILTVWFASFFPAERAVRATGLATFLNALALVLAAALGGQLAQDYGWSMPFFAAAGIGILALLALAFIPDLRAERPATAPAVSGGPLAWLDRTVIVVSLGGAACQYATYATTYGFLPLYAESLGATRAQLGWLTAVMQGAYLVGAIGVSMFVNPRIERPLALLGLAATAAACLWVPAAQTVTEVAYTRVLHGLGLGFSFPILMGLSIKHIPDQHRALVMGTFQAVYALGMTLGPAVGGFIAAGRGLPAVFSSSSLVVFAAIPFLAWGLRKSHI